MVVVAESINGFAVVARALHALGVRQIYGVIGIPVTELASAAQVSILSPGLVIFSLLLGCWQSTANTPPICIREDATFMCLYQYAVGISLLVPRARTQSFPVQHRNFWYFSWLFSSLFSGNHTISQASALGET